MPENEREEEQQKQNTPAPPEIEKGAVYNSSVQFNAALANLQNNTGQVFQKRSSNKIYKDDPNNLEYKFLYYTCFHAPSSKEPKADRKRKLKELHEENDCGVCQVKSESKNAEKEGEEETEELMDNDGENRPSKRKRMSAKTGTCGAFISLKADPTLTRLIVTSCDLRHTGHPSIKNSDCPVETELFQIKRIVMSSPPSEQEVQLEVLRRVHDYFKKGKMDLRVEPCSGGSGRVTGAADENNSVESDSKKQEETTNAKQVENVIQEKKLSVVVKTDSKKLEKPTIVKKEVKKVAQERKMPVLVKTVANNTKTTKIIQLPKQPIVITRVVPNSPMKRIIQASDFKLTSPSKSTSRIVLVKDSCLSIVRLSATAKSKATGPTASTPKRTVKKTATKSSKSKKK